MRKKERMDYVRDRKGECERDIYCRKGEGDRHAKKQRDKQQHKEDPLKSTEERVEEKLRRNRCKGEKKI